MRNATLHLFLFLSLVFASLIGIPQPASGRYVFTQIGLYQGMPSRISYVYEEHNGMIWLALPDGLTRYDGRKLKKYELGAPSADRRNPGLHIHQILEDDRFQLYVLTSYGMMRYSRQEDCFKAVEREDQRPVNAGAMCETDDGILLGGSDSLYKYSYDTDRITVFRALGTKKFRPQRMTLWSSRILVCSNRSDQLLFLDLESGEKRFVKLSEQNKITDLCVGPDGYLWVADYNNGIKKIARDGRVLKSFTTSNSPLSCNVVTSIAAIDGKIWAGTDGGGINIIDPASGQIEILRHETDNVNSLPVNTILWMHGSMRQNGVWVTTARRGLINIRRTGIQTFQNVPMGYPHGLSEKTVLSLFEEPGGGTIWIGTDGGGINRLETATHSFTHYPDTRSDKIVSICAYSPHKLFVSNFAQGFYLFDKRTGRKEPHPLDAPELNRFILYSGIPANLFNESDRSILLLAQPPMRYLTASGRLEKIEVEPGYGITGMLCPIGKDGHYSYFYDTRSIFRLAFGGRTLECIYRSQTPEFIKAAYRDDRGTFWIAGADGLYWLDGADSTLQKVENAPFRETASVLCDHKGRVWIGTGQDVVSYLPEERRFVLYGEADGARKNEYLAKPVLLSSAGEIYMGGANGLLCVDARHAPLQSAEADTREVIVTDLQIGDTNCMAGLDDGHISVPGNSRNIKLGFLVSGDDILRPRLFRYNLGGQEPQNAITTNNADLTIPSLAPGTYPIYVTYTRKDGSWSQSQQVLTLTVLPPWYRSWWFVALLAATAAVLTYLGIVALLRRKDERHRWMLSQQEHRINEEKVRFLINISHELRTPLTLIYAPLKKIVGAIRPSDPHYKQLTTAFRQSQRMKALIDMVLDVRKMEEGMDRPQLRNHPLNNWVREVCDDFTDEEGDALIECRFDPQVGKVPFDAQKCRTALTNLIINAVKHNSKGGGSIKVCTGLTTDGASVRISVTDHGPGLQGVDPSKLFTRFYQGDNEQTGSGLGLSYAKLLIDLHHGRVGAFDNPSGGATFYFELPLRPPQPTSDETPASYLNELLAPLSHQDIEIPESRDSEHFDLRPYTVLLVDDNPELIDYLVEELQPRFRRVLTAADGETAYRLAREEQPDIIVSDVMMPDMNGYELCRAIRSDIEVSHIPIILLTARNDDESRKYGYRLGADSYLGKPFELEQLLDKIRNKLYNRQQTRKHYQRLDATTAEVQQDIDDDMTSADTRFMKRLHQSVVENIDNPRLDIPLLCTLLGMSRASIYNKLKAITGMGANDYINKIRIEQAMKLLRESSMNITEISEKVGFTSPKYFSTSFKQYTGKTPSQYKKEGR